MHGVCCSRKLISQMIKFQSHFEIHQCRAHMYAQNPASVERPSLLIPVRLRVSSPSRGAGAFYTRLKRGPWKKQPVHRGFHPLRASSGGSRRAQQTLLPVWGQGSPGTTVRAEGSQKSLRPPPGCRKTPQRPDSPGRCSCGAHWPPAQKWANAPPPSVPSCLLSVCKSLNRTKRLCEPCPAKGTPPFPRCRHCRLPLTAPPAPHESLWVR